jgi:hypothetical protein
MHQSLTTKTISFAKSSNQPDLIKIPSIKINYSDVVDRKVDIHI